MDALLLHRPDPRWKALVRQALDSGLRVTVSAGEAETLEELLGECHPNLHVRVGQ